MIDFVNAPSFEENCSFCGAPFENIGHPLKPGVIMMQVCKCEYESHTTQGPNGTITVTVRKYAPQAAIVAAAATAADLDLVTMTREQLLQECEKLRAGIRKHRDASGHDLCWHATELWDLLPERIEPRPAVPPKDEFLHRCAIYRDSLGEAKK